MEKVWLNDGWLFSPVFEVKMAGVSYNEKNMEEVRIPHTVKELPFHYFDESSYQMVSGYRKHLDIPSSYKGKVLKITFDAAAHKAEVFLNGESLGVHGCGYTAFTFDITEKVKYGETNILAVKLDSRENINVPPFGYVIDYMTYGGIYRDVHLDVYEKEHIEDMFYYTEAFRGHALLNIKGKACGSLNDKQLTVYVSGTEGEDKKEIGRYLITGEDFSFEADPGKVRLWSPEKPVLYRLTAVLSDTDGKNIFDTHECCFGFRTARWKKDGFYLNGKKYKIRGLNHHQCYPYTGYAMPDAMQREDARILKEELGVNTVRTSHYPQSHAFIGECDRLGLLVFTEIPGWQHIGGETWKDQAVKNVEDMVLQYRNHPSIIMWGVRINESQDDHELYERTNAVARALDPSRQTGGVRNGRKGDFIEDVYTYNDFSHEGKRPGCLPKKEVTPDMQRAYLITEHNGHMFPTKSFDCEEKRTEHALRHANVLNAATGGRDIAGAIGWCMFDYNTHKDFGSGDRICYHGVTDMFRNPKYAAYVYAAEGLETPVLEVFSTMDIGERPAGLRGKVWISTNADSVRMYKNDRLLKEYRPEDSPYKNLMHGPILIDDYVGDEIFEDPELSEAQAGDVKIVLNELCINGYDHLSARAKAAAAKCMTIYHIDMTNPYALFRKYIGEWGGASTVYRFEAIKNGQVVKKIVKSPADGFHLNVLPDGSHRRDRDGNIILCEDKSYDVASVRITACDMNGNLLPFCNDPLSLSAEGAIKIIGPSIISLQGGMGGTYIRTTGRKGTAKLIIKSSYGAAATVDFHIL